MKLVICQLLIIAFFLSTIIVQEWYNQEHFKEIQKNKQLQESWKNVLNSIPSQIYIIDTNFQILHSNQEELVTFQELDLKFSKLMIQDKNQSLHLQCQTLNDILRKFERKKKIIYETYIQEFEFHNELMQQSNYSIGQQYEKSIYQLKIQTISFENQICFLILIEDISFNIQASIWKDQNNYKTQLLQSFSHELRTPLNGSITPIEECISDSKCPQELKDKYLLNAFGSLSYLEISLSNIVDFAEIISKQFRPNPQYFKISTIIEQVKQWVNLQLSLKKNITFEIEINQFKQVYSDQHRIKQILINILSNSIKFTLLGTIKLKVEAINIHFQDIIKFTISDTGIGIPQQQLNEIRILLANPMAKQQALNTQNSCLGLTISQNLILYLNNFNWNYCLTIESQENKGSQFTFIIQEFPKESFHSKEMLTSQDFGVNKIPDFQYCCQYCKHVMIVDDDCFNLAALSNILQKLNIKFSKAYNGFEALEKIMKYYKKKQSHKSKCQSLTCKGYQLILMDYQMPILDGIQATLRLKELIISKEIPEIPIIGCTAFSSKNQIEECLESGMSEVIIKPITYDKIKQILRKWIINW